MQLTSILILLLTSVVLMLSWKFFWGRRQLNKGKHQIEAIPTYAFRLRVDRASTDTIESLDWEIQLDSAALPAKISLRNKAPNQPIKEAQHFCLVAGGFESENAALEAGKQYEAILMIALARVRVGVDFGDRAAKGMATVEGLRQLELQHGHKILNDVHGLMAYQEQPSTKFVLVKANMLRGASPSAFQEAFRSAQVAKPVLTAQHRIAFVLYNASFFQITAESRFLLLVMSIEALITPESRSSETSEHVQHLIDSTKSAIIPELEKASMLGALQWLFKESITQAGKRLVNDRLGNRQYDKLSATKFFNHVYQMRSNLVHGNQPYPRYEAVSAISAPLELFVSDLLTQPYIDLPDY